MRNFKYNVWHNETFQIQCVTEWDISNRMWDKMGHVKYNMWQWDKCVTQWDILNTMCDTMRHFKYNVWHNETFKIQCVTMRHLKYNVWQWDI